MAMQEFMRYAGPLDHDQLVQEMPRIHALQPEQRLELAKRRREVQRRSADEREMRLPPPAKRSPRVVFTPHVALLEATGRGDVEEVERLLQNGAHPDSHNEDGLTPLHQCAIDRNLEIVNLLLQYKANVNATDTELWTPLHAAACCGYREIVEVLIAAGADLLAVNADGNMPYDICDDDESETLDLIETEMANRGITQEAINERRSLPEAQMLDDMRRLHQNGEPLDVRMPDGSTYLHVAAAHGYNTVAAFLLKCGVQPSVRDNDFWMPIHAAASWNQTELIEMLCDYGADINASTPSGDNPMKLATEEATRHTIYNIQQTEMRKRRLAFGVRDSRRQSRKRKKFESPQQQAVELTQLVDNPFSARGAIRRQSLRDRNGSTLARMEAQKEATDLMKSWSKDDLSNLNEEHFTNLPQRAQSLSDTRQRDSPSRRLPAKPSLSKNRAHSGDEWIGQFANAADEDADNSFQAGPRGSTMRKKKNKPAPEAFEMSTPSPTSATALNGKTSMYQTEKKCCCCCSIV